MSGAVRYGAKRPGTVCLRTPVLYKSVHLQHTVCVPGNFTRVPLFGTGLQGGKQPGALHPGCNAPLGGRRRVQDSGGLGGSGGALWLATGIKRRTKRPLPRLST